MALPGPRAAARAVLKLTLHPVNKAVRTEPASVLLWGRESRFLLWGWGTVSCSGGGGLSCSRGGGLVSCSGGDLMGATKLAGGLGRESVCFLPSVRF